MPANPTHQEDEYFARLEFERRRNVLDDRATQAAENDREHTLSTVTSLTYGGPNGIW